MWQLYQEDKMELTREEEIEKCSNVGKTTNNTFVLYSLNED